MISGNFERYNLLKSNGFVQKSEIEEYSNYTVSQHFSFKYVHKGQEEYLIDDEKYLINPGQFLLIKPGQRVQTTVRYNRNNKASGICLYFSENTFAIKNSVHLDLLESMYHFPEIVMRADTIKYSFLQSKDLVNINNVNADMQCELILNRFKNVLTQVNRGIHEIGASKKSTQLELWSRLEIARNFIHSNFEKKIGLKEISKIACISSFHLHRSFQSFFKLTPMQYLKMIRIKHAKMLKRQQLLRDWEIAERTGFATKYYMNKCLKGESKT